MAASSAVVGEGEEDERRSGEEALERLRSSDPALYLSPSPELSLLARSASIHLFSSLLPYCRNPPLDRLLADEAFDAEQIWSQIDLLSRPLLSLLRRHLRRLEREQPPVVEGVVAPPPVVAAEKGGRDEGDEEAGEEDEDEEMDDVDEEEGVGDEDEDGDRDEDAEDEGRKGDRVGGVEDRFLKIKELEQFLEDEEEEEYGLTEHKKTNQEKKRNHDEEEEEEEGEEGEDDDEEDEDNEGDALDFGEFNDKENEEADVAENARYKDFFGGKARSNGGDGLKDKGSTKKVKFLDGPQDMELIDQQNVGNDTKILSTHEKELLKMHSEIEQMEKTSLAPKSWTMQGEVTAAKRPKNSALEVDLDFEHNVRPAPVITEEVTTSLEDLIKKRIMEGHFDDVQRAPALPSKAPKEYKELDENKSKKGLAEIYEEEYALKTGLAPAPIAASDELKKEANVLFKKICLKLDALSHFHFAPKPVIEEMSIQANVPALAMEEIAPVAVSDAAMLAPEEIFEGKGDIKEEGELTQVDRKRRRANKKRRYKAETEKRAAKKARETSSSNHQVPGNQVS